MAKLAGNFDIMSKKYIKGLRVLSLLLLLMNSTSPAAFALSLEEQTVFAALALNIVRFTTWPTDVAAKDTLVLCVLGDNVVQQAFIGLDHKAVGNKTLQVVNLSKPRNFEQCNVLYISDEIKQNILLQILLETKKLPLLTIGESADFAEQDGMIGLNNIGGKVTLNVNLPVVRQSNLTISSRLLKLANIIDK